MERKTKPGIIIIPMTEEEKKQLWDSLNGFTFPDDLDKIIPEERKYWVAQMKDGELDFCQTSEPVSTTVTVNLKNEKET